MTEHVGSEFMKRTRYEFLGPSDQQRGRPSPPVEMPWDQSAEVIDLPGRDALEFSPVDLTDAIERRRSLRDYAAAPMTVGELSYLLWCTQGVKEVIPGAATLRTVPSAGARHAFETFLLVNRVDPLAAGLYRFLAVEHKLLALRTGEEVAGEAVRGCLGQEFVADSAAAFLWAADARRMIWRYGQRGYRYLHLDAGHVCQNLYLAAQAVGCGVCAIAAFDDDAMNRLCGLDGEEQFVIYLAAVGRMGGVAV
ncbi:MAG TPA: SagB/ThcOx family dehydrogenase [Phycisphaerae bacterium]|nr:SagB/ThcOx family dehydrogenase [Phycisphaerae bacterium]